MKVWYHIGESYRRQAARLNGEVPEPMHLYPETEEIVKAFQTPENADGWNCLGLDMEFDTLEEAYTKFYENENRYIKRMIEKYNYPNAK